MRTLVIAGDYPWPTDTGARMRLAMVLRGLEACGPTELFSVVSRWRTEFGGVEDTAGLARVDRFGFDNRTSSALHLVPTLFRPTMPLGMPWRDRRRARAALDRFVTGRYDLVWFFGMRPWVLTGGPRLAPGVVDLFDLEDQKIVARLAEPRPVADGVAPRIRRWAGDAVSREEARRWRRLQLRAARSCAVTVVCSDADAERATAAGLAPVTVVPNGYAAPTVPVGRESVGSPPTILFQGLLTYPPNAEAARWLVGEIAPALRARLPDVQVRLVGPFPADLAGLDDPPTVTLAGRVPDMEAELRRADLVLVPLRNGSGTRLKILEAFAHRIPVVSTPLGAEGLGVEPGVELLMADSAEGLAECTSRLLTDPALRASVVDRAEAHFLAHFESSSVEATVGRVADQVAGRRRRGGT